MNIHLLFIPSLLVLILFQISRTQLFSGMLQILLHQTDLTRLNQLETSWPTTD